MRSVPYSDVERGVAATAGIDPTNLLSHEKVLLSEYISDATKFCWDYYPWAEFTRTEKRYFRDEYDAAKTYNPDDEVFYQNKYYRNWQTSTAVLPSDPLYWVEVGDVDGAPDWSQTGVYKIGAKVRYNDILYLVTDTNNGEPYCFDIDGLAPDENFSVIHEQFERFIDYEQTGKDTIGTCLAVTLDDPRYNDTKPLNWREDREGIYVDPSGKSFNHVWIRYRLEAPIFDSTSTTQEIPKFLVQAIKAFAYKHFLIGDGQHEKADQQDMYGMDLLVRELDKLDTHQDRAQPFTITKHPYRRINAKQGYTTEPTTTKIGALKTAICAASISILTAHAIGKNIVKKAIIDGDPIIDISVFGYNAAKKAEAVGNIQLGIASNGLNIVKKGEVFMGFINFTGVPYRGTAIGYVQGYKLDVALGNVADANINLYVDNVARNVEKSAALQSTLNLTSNVVGRNIIQSGIASASVELSTAVTGKNIIKLGQLTSNLPIVVTASIEAVNDVILGQATADISLLVKGQLVGDYAYSFASFRVNDSSNQPDVAIRVKSDGTVLGIGDQAGENPLGTDPASQDFTDYTALSITNVKQAYFHKHTGIFLRDNGDLYYAWQEHLSGGYSVANQSLTNVAGRFLIDTGVDEIRMQLRYNVAPYLWYIKNGELYVHGVYNGTNFDFSPSSSTNVTGIGTYGITSKIDWNHTGDTAHNISWIDDDISDYAQTDDESLILKTDGTVWQDYETDFGESAHTVKALYPSYTWVGSGLPNSAYGSWQESWDWNLPTDTTGQVATWNKTNNPVVQIGRSVMLHEKGQLYHHNHASHNRTVWRTTGVTMFKEMWFDGTLTDNSSVTNDHTIVWAETNKVFFRRIVNNSPTAISNENWLGAKNCKFQTTENYNDPVLYSQSKGDGHESLALLVETSAPVAHISFGYDYLEVIDEDGILYRRESDGTVNIDRTITDVIGEKA